MLVDITWDEQEVLLKNTVHHPILLNKPINLSYQAAFLKKIIDHLSSTQIDIHDDIYSTYCTLIQKEKEKTNFHFKHYKISKDDSCIITMKENLNLISNGTTGLHTWEVNMNITIFLTFITFVLFQASLVLSEWCIQNSKNLSNKSIFELGAGAGLAGIVISKFCKLKSMWMSDCHELVINLLKENVSLNFDEKLCALSGDILKLTHDSTEIGKISNNFLFRYNS